MKGLCSYCSRYFFCSKRPKQNEEDVILCSSFTQNNDNEENIWEQRRYEIAKDVVASIIFAPSVIAPVLLTAYDVWEPVSYTEPSK